MAPLRSRSKSQTRRLPLEQDILQTGPLRNKSNKRKARPEAEDGGYVDSRSSRKILRIGQELADEEEQARIAAAPNPAFSFESRVGRDTAAEEAIEQYDDKDAWGDEDDVLEENVRCKCFQPSTQGDLI